MNTNQNVNRKSNFELLRIISMLMIVILHIGTHGIQKYTDIATTFNDLNRWLYYFFRSLSIIAVNLYVLISGYFLSKSKSKFQISKLIKLFLETSFFSLVVYAFIVFGGFVDLNLSDLIVSTFSIVFHEYWFITVYFMLYAFYPFLNRVLQNITKKEHGYLVLILFLLTCIWEFVEPSNEFGVAHGYSLIYFIFLYYLAAYIRYYGYLFLDFNKYIYFIIYILLAMINTEIVYRDIHFRTINWYSYNSPIVLLLSYSLFMFFKNLDIQLKIINISSYYILGVYLIHEQHNLRSILWRKFGIIEDILSTNENYVILITLGYSLFIFISCYLLSIIIKTVFDYLYKTLCQICRYVISPKNILSK